MTFTALVLVSLATYRLTLLVTHDRITRAPRRRLRAWSRHRAHHIASSGLHIRACSCGWSVAHSIQHGTVVQTIVAQPVPRGTPMQATELDLDWVMDAHVAQGRDASRIAYLLDCPWCIGLWLGIGMSAVVYTWPDGWWTWPALALAAAATTGVLATIAHPDTDQDDDQ